MKEKIEQIRALLPRPGPDATQVFVQKVFSLDDLTESVKCMDFFFLITMKIETYLKTPETFEQNFLSLCRGLNLQNQGSLLDILADPENQHNTLLFNIACVLYPDASLGKILKVLKPTIEKQWIISTNILEIEENGKKRKAEEVCLIGKDITKKNIGVDFLPVSLSSFRRIICIGNYAFSLNQLSMYNYEMWDAFAAYLTQFNPALRASISSHNPELTLFFQGLEHVRNTGRPLKELLLPFAKKIQLLEIDAAYPGALLAATHQLSLECQSLRRHLKQLPADTIECMGAIYNSDAVLAGIHDVAKFDTSDFNEDALDELQKQQIKDVQKRFVGRGLINMINEYADHPVFNSIPYFSPRECSDFADKFVIKGIPLDGKMPTITLPPALVKKFYKRLDITSIDWAVSLLHSIRPQDYLLFLRSVNLGLDLYKYVDVLLNHLTAEQTEPFLKALVQKWKETDKTTLWNAFWFVKNTALLEKVLTLFTPDYSVDQLMEERDIYGCSALHLAAWINPSALRILLTQLSPHMRARACLVEDSRSQSPLHYAVDNKESMEILFSELPQHGLWRAILKKNNKGENILFRNATFIPTLTYILSVLTPSQRVSAGELLLPKISAHPWSVLVVIESLPIEERFPVLMKHGTLLTLYKQKKTGYFLVLEDILSLLPADNIVAAIKAILPDEPEQLSFLQLLQKGLIQELEQEKKTETSEQIPMYEGLSGSEEEIDQVDSEAMEETSSEDECEEETSSEDESEEETSSEDESEEETSSEDESEDENIEEQNEDMVKLKVNWRLFERIFSLLNFKERLELLTDTNFTNFLSLLYVVIDKPKYLNYFLDCLENEEDCLQAILSVNEEGDRPIDGVCTLDALHAVVAHIPEGSRVEMLTHTNQFDRARLHNIITSDKSRNAPEKLIGLLDILAFIPNGERLNVITLFTTKSHKGLDWLTMWATTDELSSFWEPLCRLLSPDECKMLHDEFHSGDKHVLVPDLRPMLKKFLEPNPVVGVSAIGIFGSFIAPRVAPNFDLSCQEELDPDSLTGSPSFS